MANKRLLELDYAKAICIILVVMGHYSIGHPWWWNVIHDVIYTFHMPLFLFASGYIYIAFKRDEPFKSFILRKFRRLMIPYFVTSVTVITLKLLSQNNNLEVDNPVSFFSYLRILWYPEAGYYLWFVWALWWMFCIVFFFRTPKSRMLLFLFSFILHTIFPYLQLTSVFCFAQTTKMFIWFLLGVIVYDYHEEIKRYNTIPLSAYVVLFLLGQVFYLIKFGVNLLEEILPVLGIIVVILLSRKIVQSNIKEKWFSLVATSSYMIYLFHTTFMGLVKAVLIKIPLMQLENDFVYTIAIVIVVTSGVVVPVYLFRIVRTNNVLSFLFGLK